MNKRLLSFFPLLLVGVVIFAQNPAPIGVEFLVNTTQSGTQQKPAINDNSNGNMVIAWESPDASGEGIYAQIYNSSFATVSGEFRVNVNQSSSQRHARVSLFENGSFVVAWYSLSGTTLKFRVFDDIGNPLTGELTGPDIGTGASQSFDIDTDGDTVIVFAYQNRNGSGDRTIKARRYYKNGSSLGGIINVSETPGVFYDQPSVAMHSDRRFVVAYDKSGSGILYQKRYNSSGVPVIPETAVMTNGSNYSYNHNDVDMNSSGEYLITSNVLNTGGLKSMRHRSYDINGNPLTGALTSYQEINASQVYQGDGAINEGGNVAISWDRKPLSGGNFDVYSRLYTAAGSSMAGQFTVPTTTSGEQNYPEVHFMHDGTLMYVWSGNGFVGDATGIYAIRYNAPAYPCTSASTPTLSANVSICDGDNTTLSVTAGTLNDNADWEWYSGSCGGTAVGTGSSINVSPTSTTTYFARGEGSCANGSCASVTVTVNPLPTVTATGTATICDGQSTSLSATGASTYAWDNGGGSGATVSVSPNSTTVYTVTGTDGNGCQNTDQVTVTVNPLPTVTATGTATICDGQSTSLSATGASTYAWDNGGGSGATVSVSPNSTTVYTVTGTDGNGCQNTDQVTVTVNPLPTVTATGTATICDGQSTSLSATGASTYAWDNGAGTGATVSVSPSSTTIYTVTGTDGNGCQNTDQVTVTVNPLPTVTATGTATICDGQSTNLSATGASTYAWDNGGGSGATVSVSPSSTTIYTVTGTDGNGCQNTDQVTVTVNPLPTVTATGTATICDGQSTNLSATGASTYAWDNGGGSGATVSVSPSSTTIYTVTGTDGNGCQNTDQVTVTVNPLPTVTATGTATICDGQSTNLSATGASTYAWDNGGGSGATVSVSPSSTTIYTVTGTDGNGCQNTDQVTVTVNPLPDTTVTMNTNILTAQLAGANSYQWIDCNNGFAPIVGETGQVFTVTANGSYAVIVSDGGCTDTSGCYAVIGIGLEEYGLNNNLQLYPNPVEDSFVMEFGDSYKKIEIHIYNTLGKLIDNYSLAGKSRLEVSASDFASGLYSIQVKADEKIGVIKMIKK